VRLSALWVRLACHHERHETGSGFGRHKAPVADAETGQKAGAQGDRGGGKKTKKTTSNVAQRRADYGSPVEKFFAKQPSAIAAILNALRELVLEAAPAAEGTLKWGMPFFTLDGETVCAFGAFKSHDNLILPGPPGTYDDPDGRLEGEGKTGKHLKLRSVGELPRDSIRGWLRTSVVRAKRA
jgi:hypothetical protein